MKKLKKSFIKSRITKVENFSPSWHLQNASAQDFFYSLDMRLCNLSYIEKELSLLINSTTKLNLMMNTTSNAVVAQEVNNVEDELNLPDAEFLLKLDLSINELTFLKYSDLARFVNLRHLTASFNSIADISGFAACSYLCHICLSYNNIKSLNRSILEHCKYLVHLDLRSNLLRDVSEFPSLPSLRYLNLSYNLLQTLDGLQALFALQELYVQHNQINNIVGLSACLAVQVLNLSYNRLDDPLIVVDTLNHLMEIYDLDVRENNFNDDIYKKLQNNSKIKLFNGSFVGYFHEGLQKLYKNSSSFASAKDLQSQVKLQALKELDRKKEEIKNDYSEKLQYLHNKILSLKEEVENELQKDEEKFSKWCVYIDGLSEDELIVLVRHGLRNDDTVESPILSTKQIESSKKTKHSSGPQETNQLLSTVADVLSKKASK